MSTASYPAFFDKLSKLSIPAEIARAWVMTDRAQVLFYEVVEGSRSDDLAEGAEWGLILEGQVDITIDGETTSYHKGDTYLIPGGVPNHKVNHPGVIGIDVFEQSDRFTELVD